MLATVAGIAGSKDSSVDDFNKFVVLDDKSKAPEKKVDTKSAMASLRNNFK